jgi:hypothetical protein
MRLDRDYMTINNFKADSDGVVKFVEWDYDWTDVRFPGTTVKSRFVSRLPEPNYDDFIEMDLLNKLILCDWANNVEDERLNIIFERSILEHMAHQYELDQCQTFYLGA